MGHNNRRVMRIALICAFGALLIGCNIFNPGELGSSGELSTNGKLLEAEKMLRDGKNSKAARLFQEVIAKDSTRSKAYFGLAKATVRLHEISPTLLLSFVETFQEEDPLQAAVELAATLNPKTITGMTETKNVLVPLMLRDSLQNVWEERGVATAPYRAADYPLTDGIITGKRISLDFQILLAVETFIFFNNLKQVITNGIDQDLLECSPFVDPNCDFDAAELLDRAQADSLLRNDLIAQLTNLSNNIDQLSSLAGGMLNLNDSEIIAGDPDANLDDEAVQLNLTETDSLINDYLDKLSSQNSP